jgi:hypothetical protein
LSKGFSDSSCQCVIALAHQCDVWKKMHHSISSQINMTSFSFRNEMACSSMDNIMHPGLHADILPGLQDSYGLAFSDFLSDDIPCYPPMQSELHAGIGASNSEVRLPGTLILVPCAGCKIEANRYCISCMDNEVVFPGFSLLLSGYYHHG